MKYLAVFLAVALLMPVVVDAKGGGGGGRSSGGGSRSVSSTSKPTSTPSASKPSAPSTPKVSSKPSSTTKTVNAPVKTTSTGKKTTGQAKVVDDTYKPKVRGGYVPPNGSTVQYVERNTSFVDYLPWIYIFSQSSRDEVNKQEAVVTEPDGTEKTVELEPEGGDGLLILNRIIMILLGVGIIYGAMKLVNMFTNKKSYV